MAKTITACLLSALVTTSLSSPIESGNLEERATNGYAPVQGKCPSTSLVRPATSLNSQESSYVSSRKSKANAGLASWLKKQGSFSTSSLPVVALASSGGGYRALLSTAGVVQGLDIRDSNVGTSGVYQGLTYESGLSGGSWFLSSLAGNNWPTVTSLKTGLWESAFQDSLLLPSNLLSISSIGTYAETTADVAAKQKAGYDVTIVDPYGRLLSAQLLYGSDGGVSDRLSSLTSLSNFTAHNVPYPIITTTSDFPAKGQCYPTLDSPIFEFHPYEYGSWDSGVSAFANTQYMGTNMKGGKPVSSSSCTTNYDNLGYIFGTSSDVFNGACEQIASSNNTSDLAEVLEAIVTATSKAQINDEFGIYPNPFYQYSRSSMVSGDKLLTLSDGGETLQNIPIWPFIQPERNVNVLIASDNSADTTDNFPNGTEIHQTYLRAQATGLKKMPFIPDVSTFVSEGLNKRATFFGCNETGTMFIVYLPNVNYTFPSNEPTAKLEYTKAETDGMIANGVEIATQNGDKQWPFCFACAIKNADGKKLPKGCNACFKKYCYKQ